MASRGLTVLKGCAIGCGVVALLLVGSCAGFVVWVNQPGELAQVEQLVGADTAGFVQWTLRLEDPGTEALVHACLETFANARDQQKTPLPPVIDSWLKRYQKRQDARQARELFPLVVAWQMRPGPVPDEDLHLLTISIESLGNRVVLADWILAFVFARVPEAEVVRSGGEKIFSFEEGGAFFLRRSDIVVASDVETAELAVQRLKSSGNDAAGELDRLLAALPGEAALNGALSNQRGELGRVMHRVGHLPGFEGLAPLRWEAVHSLVLHGGFTAQKDFVVTVVLEASSGFFDEEDAELASTAIAEGLGGAEEGVHSSASVVGDTLVVKVRVADLPARLEAVMDEAISQSAAVRY